MIAYSRTVMVTSTRIAVDQVIGIDIGKVGNIALSTGFQMVIKTEQDTYNLFRQIFQYNANIIALEEHNDYSKNERKSIKGLFIANDLIIRYAKSRLNAKINIIYVDKFKSSVICSKCKFVDRASRVTSWLFKCTCCGRRINADVNAALNIKFAAEEKITKSKIKWDY